MVHPFLPLEILDEIIRLSPISLQLTLCRTSRLLRSMATRSLYTHISLNTSSSLMRLCTTLCSNLFAAACIKSLLIAYMPTEPPNVVYLASFYSNLKSALLNLHNIQTLRFLVSDPHLTQTLFCSATGTLRFPSLRHFETCLPLTDPLLRFVERHPKLTYLQVSQYENFSLDENATKCSDCSRVPQKPAFLNLRHYVGNSVYLPLLAPISPLPLRSAHLTWSAVHECRASITSLAQASSDTLNVLTCRRRGWNVDLIEYVASQLSDVYMLHIINVLVMDAELSEDFQHGIAGHLARFRRLQRLKITHEMGWRPSAVPFDLDREFAVVTDWGAACPSLVIITLPHSDPHIEWHRVADNIWIPSDTSPGETARRWLRDSVRGRKYPRTLKNLRQLEGHLSQSLATSLVNETI